MSIRDRILTHLRAIYPDGLDDDELSRVLALRYRQDANARCRDLEAEGLVTRRRTNGKITNFAGLGGSAGAASPTTPTVPPGQSAPSRPWYWEGNVQAAAIAFLQRHGWTVTSSCDTATREQGRDVEAEKDGRPLWVTVKGWPRKTAKTQPSTQAGHWFKGGLFDIIAWRGETPDVELAYALPDFPRYRKLAARAGWLQPVARFWYIWVKDTNSGLSVTVSGPDATSQSGASVAASRDVAPFLSGGKRDQK